MFFSKFCSQGCILWPLQRESAWCSKTWWGTAKENPGPLKHTMRMDPKHLTAWNGLTGLKLIFWNPFDMLGGTVISKFQMNGEQFFPRPLKFWQNGMLFPKINPGHLFCHHEWYMFNSKSYESYIYIGLSESLKPSWTTWNFNIGEKCRIWGFGGIQDTSKMKPFGV